MAGRVLVWTASACLAASVPVGALAAPAEDDSWINRLRNASEDPASVGMMVPQQRTWRNLNQIFQFDRAPLRNRIPVILVPGRAEEFQHNSWWKDINIAASRHRHFDEHFKLYVFLYNSKDELDVQAEELSRELRQRFGHLPPEQPLLLVTYSLGGVIVREVMKDDDLLARMDTQIAIAVPFHGSPLFDPKWFSEYLRPPNRSPVRKFWDRLIYRAYMFSKSNLTRGLRWDNFDSSKPEFDLEEATRQSGDTVYAVVPPYQEYPNADAIRAKTIIYASYLENSYTRTSQSLRPKKLPRYVLENSLTLPKEMVATVLPLYGLTVHSVFTYMNHQLANIPTYTPDDPQGRNTHLYRFNDGAIPLSSMLFLPPSKTPYHGELMDLINAATVRQVRIFPNLDHMHIGEYSFRKKILVTPDLLSADEGKRSPNQWILYDLFRRLAALQAPRPIAMPAPLPNKPVVSPVPVGVPTVSGDLIQHGQGVDDKAQVEQPAEQEGLRQQPGLEPGHRIDAQGRNQTEDDVDHGLRIEHPGGEGHADRSGDAALEDHSPGDVP